MDLACGSVGVVLSNCVSVWKVYSACDERGGVLLEYGWCRSEGFILVNDSSSALYMTFSSLDVCYLRGTGVFTSREK